MSSIQVQPDHYYGLSYDNKNRFISYWHQIKEVIETSPLKVLEIGIGNGFVSNYLRERELDIVTLDIDKRLHPDIVGSILQLPVENDEYDTVTCFEVLEHLPFEKVSKALAELKRVSSKKVIISLPDRTLHYKFLLKLPILKQKSFLISIPGILEKNHKFDGQHYWELGKKGYSVKKFKNLIKQQGFRIDKSYRPFEVPGHHFFVLSV